MQELIFWFVVLMLVQSLCDIGEECTLRWAKKHKGWSGRLRRRVALAVLGGEEARGVRKRKNPLI